MRHSPHSCRGVILSEAKDLRILQRLQPSLWLAATVLLSLLPLALHAQSPQLTAVFAQMDAASKRFESATADVQRETYERVVHDTTVETGAMFIERTHGGIEFGATIGEPKASSPSRIVRFSGGSLQLYTPAEKQVDAFKSGANQAKLEGYFALGFGGTSQALTSAWTVTDAGPETLADGATQIKTEKLVLVSKDPAAQSTFRQVTVWLDPARDVSLKQLFDTPSGNHQTATYTNIRLNTRVNTAPYKIPTGKGITIINH